MLLEVHKHVSWENLTKYFVHPCSIVAAKAGSSWQERAGGAAEQDIGQDRTKLHQQVLGDKSLVTLVPLDKPQNKQVPRNERNVSGRE